MNAPRIAVTPIASGRLAAAKLPKMITSSTAQDRQRDALGPRDVGADLPVDVGVDDGVAADLRLEAGGGQVVADLLRWPPRPRRRSSCRTAKVDCRSVLTRLGAPVLQKVVVRSTRPSGSARRESSTAVW